MAVWALLPVIAVLAAWLGWAAAAWGSTGSVHTTSAKGVILSIDTRWVNGSGYRPVAITVTPTAPVVADRTLTVEMLVSRYWNYGRYDLVVKQDIEVPAGSGPVRATMSVPQMAGWNSYQINVLEDGKAIRGLASSGAGDNYQVWAWEERMPAVLVVGDSAPDTSNLGKPFELAQYYQYAQGGASPPATGPQQGNGAFPYPALVVRPPADLPRRFLDYTNLDLVFVTLDQLQSLKARHPDAFQALMDWTAAGGTLFVSGVGSDWSGLPRLESLVGLKPGGDPSARHPLVRGWTGPDADLWGKVLTGFGSAEGSQYGPPSGPVNYGPGELPDVTPQAPPRPPGEPGLVFHPFQAGLIVACTRSDPFTYSEHEWRWILTCLGSHRLLWYQRHGVSTLQNNPDFWMFLIPGVGLAPIGAFQVLITLFVVAIGPLNYWLLRRWNRLYLLVVTIPAGAVVVTFSLLGYALVSDGLGTRVRVRSVTRIDQAHGRAVCWSRLSFYSGLAPAGGLTFPDDVMVVPLDPRPSDTRSLQRSLLWQKDQWLADGWLASRTPTQFVTVRARKTAAGIEVLGQAGNLRVKNNLGTTVRELLVCGEDGQHYWAENLAAGATAQGVPVPAGEGLRRLRTACALRAPQLPATLDRQTLQQLNDPNRWTNRWMFNQSGDLPVPKQNTSVLEWAIGTLGATWKSGLQALEPRTYTAIVERSPEVELGTGYAREEASLHVILGSWQGPR